MCPPEHLHDQAGWNSPISSSRERLLSELSSKSPQESKVEEILIGYRIHFAVCNDPGQPSCYIIRSCQEEPDKSVLISQYGNSPVLILGSHV